MTRDQLTRIIGAQDAIIDHLLKPYLAARGGLPREVTVALLEVKRIQDGEVMDLTQNLVTSIYEVAE